MKEPDGQLRCAECGGAWDDAALRRGQSYLYQPRSRFGWLLMYGPGCALPLVMIVLCALFESHLEVAFGLSILLLAAYALVHSRRTTPPRPDRLAFVMMRTIVFLFVNLLTAVMVCSAWFLLCCILVGLLSLIFPQ